MHPTSETLFAAAFLWKAIVQQVVGIKNDGLKELSIVEGPTMENARPWLVALAAQRAKPFGLK